MKTVGHDTKCRSSFISPLLNMLLYMQCEKGEKRGPWGEPSGIKLEKEKKKKALREGLASKPHSLLLKNVPNSH